MNRERPVPVYGDPAATILKEAENRKLRIWISILGCVQSASLALLGLVSYACLLQTPFGKVEANEAAFYRDWSADLAWLGADSALDMATKYVSKPIGYRFAYGLPLFVSTLTFVVLLLILTKYRNSIDSNTTTQCFRWATLFAVVLIPGAPVIQDFWLSAAWGQMVVQGHNPYHEVLTTEIVQGLPLDYLGQRMTYGPLWALVSATVMWISGGQTLWAALMFKIILASAWIGSLRLVWLLLRDQPYWRQCLGISIFGWLPLSAIQIVGEGHNDIMMVCHILFWLHGLRNGQSVRSSVALAASVLVKYVSAPLFLLDWLHSRYVRKSPWLHYLSQTALSGCLVFLVFALFFRSPEFFAETAGMAKWKFLTPNFGVYELGSQLGLDLKIPAWIVRGSFPLMALYATFRYWQQPNNERFTFAVLALMSSVVFSVVGHVWPWFLLWLLGPAALSASTVMARWAVGVTLVAPFSFLIISTMPADQPLRYRIATFVLYGLALVWISLVPKKWFIEEYQTPNDCQLGYPNTRLDMDRSTAI